jgi:UMF1 family MFS transporter
MDRSAIEALASASPVMPATTVGRRGVFSWLIFDWAAQPFYTLITTFVFAPYFASAVAANAVEGQAAWGFAAAAAGVVIALLSPALGAIADAGGRRKPWIAAFSLLLVLGTAALWFAAPGAENAVAIALAGFIVATLGAEFATVFTNAMMPDLVPEERLGRLSGTGWAMGYVGGLLSLALVLGLLVGDPGTGKTLAGMEPLFGLDPAAREGDRASGPFSALWYLVFVLPLFLFTPDTPRRMAAGAAVRTGLASLRTTLTGLRRYRNAVRYLIAHMVYADGLAGLFVFGGIYAAGTFGWGSIELGLFGVLLAFAGAVGAAIGGGLDDRLGPKPVILGALALLALTSVGVLSIDEDTVLFGIAVAPPVAGDGLFTSAGERLYLALGALIGLCAGPMQAASRVLLVHVAPREKMTEFFGLHALSGKITSFAAPLLVGLLTTISGSQRVGISVLVAFFVVGALLLLRVNAGRAGA